MSGRCVRAGPDAAIPAESLRLDSVSPNQKKGSGRAKRRAASEALFHLNGRRRFDVAAESLAHGGEDLFGEGMILARAEPGIERC